jgi:hypothetical protein
MRDMEWVHALFALWHATYAGSMVNMADKGGRFHTAQVQRAHRANYHVVYPGNTPENHPPHRSMHDQFKTACGADFRALGPVASIRLKQKKKSLVYQ